MLKAEYDRTKTVSAIHKLRVNVKSLAAEAKIIRAEERRAGPAFRDVLHLHRVGRLRSEARRTQLALAFLRSRPYKTVEQKTHKPVVPAELCEKLKRVIWTADLEATLEAKLNNWLNQE